MVIASSCVQYSCLTLQMPVWDTQYMHNVFSMIGPIGVHHGAPYSVNALRFGLRYCLDIGLWSQLCCCAVGLTDTHSRYLLYRLPPRPHGKCLSTTGPCFQVGSCMAPPHVFYRSLCQS